jgi:hypothetical protein
MFFAIYYPAAQKQQQQDETQHIWHQSRTLRPPFVARSKATHHLQSIKYIAASGEPNTCEKSQSCENFSRSLWIYSNVSFVRGKTIGHEICSYCDHDSRCNSMSHVDLCSNDAQGYKHLPLRWARARLRLIACACDLCFEHALVDPVGQLSF